jgi:hypothetical protein
MVNHRFIVNRLQLLASNKSEGIEPRASAAGENDAFHGGMLGKVEIWKAES